MVATHIGGKPHDAVVAATRLLGYQRAGAELEQVIDEQLRSLLGSGALELRNGNRLHVAARSCLSELGRRRG